MRRSRRLRMACVVTTVLTTLWAFAPAGMAKGRPGNPGGGSSLAVEVVDFAGNPMWSVLETTAEAPFGDRVALRVSLDGEPVTGPVTVALTSGDYDFITDAKGTTPLYTVQETDLRTVVGSRPSEPDRRVFAGTVESGDLEASFEIEKADQFGTVVSYPECFPDQSDPVYNDVSQTRMECRWHPTTTGVWKATLRPAVEGRKVAVRVSLRDHGHAGNWCATTADGPVGTAERLGPDDELVWEFYLPASGVCLRDGDDTTIGVGNPATYFLEFQGALTLEWVRGTP